MKIQSFGFTLLEVLLSLSVVGGLFAMMVPVYLNMYKKNELDIAVAAVVQNLRRAATLSAGVDGDVGWGVLVQSGNLTLFQGNTYAARDSQRDETTSLSSAVNITGLTEIDFYKFTATPAATGTLTLATSSDIATISVNAKGMVSY